MLISELEVKQKNIDEKWNEIQNQFMEIKC